MGVNKCEHKETSVIIIRLLLLEAHTIRSISNLKSITFNILVARLDGDSNSM